MQIAPNRWFMRIFSLTIPINCKQNFKYTQKWEILYRFSQNVHNFHIVLTCAKIQNTVSYSSVVATITFGAEIPRSCVPLQILHKAVFVPAQNRLLIASTRRLNTSFLRPPPICAERYLFTGNKKVSKTIDHDSFTYFYDSIISLLIFFVIKIAFNIKYLQ